MAVNVLKYWHGKVRPRTGHEGLLYSFFNLGARRGWVDNATPRPLYARYPLYRRLGGPQGRSGRVRKISLLPGFDPRTVQPVASRYTDWAISAHDTICDQTLASIQVTGDECGELGRRLHCYSFKYNQQDATLYNILYYWQCSTCFRRFLRPSLGAQNYTQHLV